MPVLLSVSKLQPGMRLAKNLSNRYSNLLTHGRGLKPGDIKALQERFPTLMVPVVDPLLDDCFEFEDDAQAHEVSQTVRRKIATVSKKVNRTIQEGVKLEERDLAGIQNAIEQMVQYLKDNPVTMAVIEKSTEWSNYLQEHSANVFYLSLVIGNTLRRYIKDERHRLSSAKTISDAMDITPLGTAALFHDIGMVPIEHLYNKKEPLTPEEVEQIRQHPLVGAKMLPTKLHPIIHLTVRTHHENHNGTGYPKGLPGDRICIFGRIIRVADAYSAIVSSTKFRDVKSPIRALYEMLYDHCRHYYDPIILRVFASIIKPLPVGGKLKLNTGRHAVVVGHNLRDPFNPQLVVAFDEKEKPLPKAALEGPFFLKQRENLRIESFADEDISYLNNVTNEQDDELNERLAQVYRPRRTDVLEHSYP